MSPLVSSVCPCVLVSVWILSCFLSVRPQKSCRAKRHCSRLCPCNAKSPFREEVPVYPSLEEFSCPRKSLPFVLSMVGLPNHVSCVQHSSVCAPLTVAPVFADGVHCLTCAMMLLNTDLHGHVSVGL